MRNFKKILSLVLCMAMMLSVMVVGAGAAFKDQEKIVNTEAVDVCAALNIINGYTDGSFKPEGTITRAEACKMICVALNGGKEPVLGTNATATFTDIKGHWAEKYIEYCVSEGIVAGIGGGKFNPNGNVTGSQFAKMLLIALGFNAQHAQFLGNAWEVNVNVKATQKGLYEDLETMDPAVALTRDNAAQMVWNALQALTVEYDYTLVSDNGSLSSQVTVKDTKDTLLWEKYNALIEDEGVLTGVKYDDKNDDYDTTVNGMAGFNADKDYSDLMGQNVKVIYKAKLSADGKSYTFDTLYGLYATDKNQTVTALYGDVKFVDDDTIEIDDTEYDLAANFKSVGLNGEVVKADHYSWQDYYKATLIDNNDDDKYEVAVGNPFDVVKVKSVTTDKIYFEGADSQKIEDCDLYDGIAKDDYVMLTIKDYTVSGLYEVVKADEISGEVTNTKDDGSIKVDGTWYSRADACTDTAPDAGDILTSAVVVNGYYFTADTSSSTSAKNTVVVLAQGSKDWKGDYYDAELMFANGDIETTKAYAEDEDGDPIANGLKENVIYTYEKKTDGYVLTEVTNGADIDVGDGDPIKNTENNSVNYSAETNKVAGKRVASDAVVFVKYDTNKGKVLTGADIDAWKDSTTAPVYVAFADKTVEIMYLDMSDLDKIPGASSDAAYAVIVDEVVAGKDDTQVTTLWTADGLVKDAVVTAGSNTELTENMVYEYTMDGEEYELTAVDYIVGAVTDIDGNYITVLDEDGNEVEYKMTKDTDNLFVDTKDSTGATSGAVTEAIEFEQDKFYANVIIVLDDDDSTADFELGLIVVDLDNKLLDEDGDEYVVERRNATPEEGGSTETPAEE